MSAQQATIPDLEVRPDATKAPADKGGGDRSFGTVDRSVKIDDVTAAVSTRRPVFVWLLAATMLPALIVVGSAGVGVMPPVNLMVLLFGAAHVPTTFGLYADPDLRPFLRAHPWRCVVIPCLLVAGAGLTAVVVPGDWLPYLITGFVAWQIHHFTKQNLGMVSFYCRASQLGGSDTVERRLIIATGVAGMLGMAPHLDDYAEGYVPGEELLWHVGRVLLVVVGAVLVARTEPNRRLPLAAVALFFAPLYLFPNNFEAAVLGFVVAHGAQYYLMVGHLAAPSRVLRWILVWSAVVGYVVMAAPSAGFLWGAVYGVTMAHFVVDAGMWRMRDAERRAYITDRFAFLR